MVYLIFQNPKPLERRRKVVMTDKQCWHLETFKVKCLVFILFRIKCILWSLNLVVMHVVKIYNSHDPLTLRIWIIKIASWYYGNTVTVSSQACSYINWNPFIITSIYAILIHLFLSTKRFQYVHVIFLISIFSMGVCPSRMIILLDINQDMSIFLGSECIMLKL